MTAVTLQKFVLVTNQNANCLRKYPAFRSVLFGLQYISTSYYTESRFQRNKEKRYDIDTLIIFKSKHIGSRKQDPERKDDMNSISVVNNDKTMNCSKDNLPVPS